MKNINQSDPLGRPESAPMPDNYLDDSEWIRENLDELDAQYHMRWIAVFHREVIGVGDTEEEAIRAARTAKGPDTTPYLERIRSALLGTWRIARKAG